MSVIKEIMESKMAKKYLAIVGGIIGLIILVIIIASIVSSCNSSKSDESNNKEAIKKNATTELQETTEEPTTDNRPQINPFDYFSIEVRYYDSEQDGEIESYGYDSSEDDYINKDLLYVYFKYKEDKDKKEEFEDIDLEVYSEESGEICDKTVNGGFVVPNKTDVTISVSEESKDEYIKYHFVPNEKTMTIEGPKIISSVRDIGSYKSKKLNYLKRITKKQLKNENDDVRNIQYLGYYYFKPDSDYNEANTESNPYLVIIFKCLDPYYAQEKNPVCYYGLKVNNPIIKKGKITANNIKDLKDKYNYEFFNVAYDEKGLFDHYSEEGYKSYIKGKLKDYSNNIDE